MSRMFTSQDEAVLISTRCVILDRDVTQWSIINKAIPTMGLCLTTLCAFHLL